MFDTEKFIKLVEKNIALWHKNCPEYYLPNLKRDGWNTAGVAMFDTWAEMTPEERLEKVKFLKEKWRHLRDNYARFVNQESSADLWPCKKSKYRHAPYLKFLYPLVSKKRFEGQGIEEGAAENLLHDSDAPEEETPEKKPNIIRKKNHDTAFKKELLSKLDVPKPAEDDPEKQFLLSLLPDFKELSADEKLDYRVHMLQFFKDIRQKTKKTEENNYQNFEITSINAPSVFTYITTDFCNYNTSPIKK